MIYIFKCVMFGFIFAVAQCYYFQQKYTKVSVIFAAYLFRIYATVTMTMLLTAYEKKIHSGFFLDFSILERLMSHGQNVFSGTTHIFTMNERRRYDAMYGILFFSDDNIYRTPNVLYSTKALDKVTIFPFLVWIGVAAENFKIWYDFISEIYIDSVVQQKTKCECWIKIFLVTIQFNGFLFCYRWNDK